MPYRFLEDIATADVAFAAWGETREELFSAAAEALLRTMVEETAAVEPRDEVSVSLEHAELDLLLFDFLSELVFLKDARRLLLRPCSLRIDGSDGGYRLEAVMKGERIAPLRHRPLVDVKGVTLHRLAVDLVDGEWQGTVVLDI